MDLHDIIAALHVQQSPEGHRHYRDGWVHIDCPWCGGTGYYCGISERSLATTCWRCGRHDTAKTLEAASHGHTAAEIRAWLDDRPHTPRHDPSQQPRPSRVVLPRGLQSLGPSHIAYLEHRGYDAGRVADIWGLRGLDGMAPRLRWRIWIPVQAKGRVVSWTTRAIGTTHARYISASLEEETVPHKTLLYGADMATTAIIAHEGPTDCWATGPGSVASFGLGYTPEQIRAMSRYPVRVLCFDSEPEAQRRATALARELALYGGQTKIVALESGNDAGKAHPDELREIRELAGLDPALIGRIRP